MLFFVRAITLSGMRAGYRAPREWPVPTDLWLRDNEFWQPAPGWTPVPGLSPAPQDWAFWVPTRAWHRSMAPLNPRWGTTFVAVLLLASWAARVVAIVFAGKLGPAAATALWWAGSAGFVIAVPLGIAGLIVFSVRKRRQWARHVRRAGEQRHDRLYRGYAAYLERG